MNFHVYRRVSWCHYSCSTKNDTTYWIPKREGLLADAPNLARILVKHVARMMAIVCYIMFEYLNMSMSYIHGLGFSQEPWPASKCCQIHQTVGVWPCPHPKLQSSLFTFWHPQALNKRNARLGIQLAITRHPVPSHKRSHMQLPLYPPHPQIAAHQPTQPTMPDMKAMARSRRPWGSLQVGRFQKNRDFWEVQCHPKNQQMSSEKGPFYQEKKIEFHRPTIGP